MVKSISGFLSPFIHGNRGIFVPILCISFLFSELSLSLNYIHLKGTKGSVPMEGSIRLPFNLSGTIFGLDIVI